MFNMQHLFVALATLALAAAPAAAQKSTTINIATTISGVAPAAGTLPDPGFLVRSDGGSEYASLTEARVKTVTNVLIVNQAPGSDWSLTTYSLSPSKLVQSSRKMFFDLRYLDPSDGVVPEGYARFFTTPALSVAGAERLPYGKTTAHLVAKCSEASPAVDFRTMSTGSVAYCPGSMRLLDVDGQWYRLSFAPDSFAGVDLYKIVCTAADAKGCAAWTLTPESSTNPPDVSQQGLQRLLKIDSGGAIQAVGGLYHLSFSIGLRRL